MAKYNGIPNPKHTTACDTNSDNACVNQTICEPLPDNNHTNGINNALSNVGGIGAKYGLLNRYAVSSPATSVTAAPNKTSTIPKAENTFDTAQPIVRPITVQGATAGNTVNASAGRICKYGFSARVPKGNVNTTYNDATNALIAIIFAENFICYVLPKSRLGKISLCVVF